MPEARTLSLDMLDTPSATGAYPYQLRQDLVQLPRRYPPVTSSDRPFPTQYDFPNLSSASWSPRGTSSALSSALPPLSTLHHPPWPFSLLTAYSIISLHVTGTQSCVTKAVSPVVSPGVFLRSPFIHISSSSQAWYRAHVLRGEPRCDLWSDKLSFVCLLSSSALVRLGHIGAINRCCSSTSLERCPWCAEGLLLPPYIHTSFTTPSLLDDFPSFHDLRI
ncbi:hypothetical protein NMY22_g14401 [Coprinellus aureogranulatus]|nr:hypothetical protein NMY22_g14401 [Coprinellus aureogranulatus]